jgi:hypothetical protein
LGRGLRGGDGLGTGLRGGDCRTGVRGAGFGGAGVGAYSYQRQRPPVVAALMRGDRRPAVRAPAQVNELGRGKRWRDHRLTVHAPCACAGAFCIACPFTGAGCSR